MGELTLQTRLSEDLKAEKSSTGLLTTSLKNLLAGSVSGHAIRMCEKQLPSLRDACRYLLDASMLRVSGVPIGDASLPYLGQTRPTIDKDMREWVIGVDYTRTDRPLNMVSCTSAL